MIVNDPGHSYRLGGGVELRFINKTSEGHVIHGGTTCEEVIAVLLDRLGTLNSGPYRCRENSLAITALEEARLWLHARMARRIATGTVGQPRGHEDATLHDALEALLMMSTLDNLKPEPERVAPPQDDYVVHFRDSQAMSLGESFTVGVRASDDEQAIRTAMAVALAQRTLRELMRLDAAVQRKGADTARMYRIHPSAISQDGFHVEAIQALRVDGSPPAPTTGATHGSEEGRQGEGQGRQG